MPAPTNINAATAIDLGTLPATVTQDVNFGGTTYTVWYKYTVRPGDFVIGVFGFGDLVAYAPIVVVFGPNSGVSNYLGITANNVPVQFPATSVGDVFYFQFSSSGGNVATAVLTLSVSQAPASAVPIGSLVINDDVTDFPLAVLSAADGSVLAFKDVRPASDWGSVSPKSGIYAYSDLTNDQIRLYDASFALITAVPALASTSGFLANDRQHTFYVGYANTAPAKATVQTFSDAGVVGATTWTLDDVGVVCGAPSLNNTILYYSGTGGSLNASIKRWDLVNDVQLTDLAAGGGSGYVTLKDLLVLSDGTIIAGYQHSTTHDFFCRHYSAAGATLRTYSFGTIALNGPSRFTQGLDDPNSFWVWIHLSTGKGRFINVKVSDGSTLLTFDRTEFENGENDAAPTATPDLFGFSNSCPVLVAALAPAVPTYTTTERIIRRLRRAPHIASQGNRVFHKRFLLDLQPGIGNVVDPGKTPEVMLRWSDNGGQTWSSEHWMSAGELGHYFTRLQTFQLGQARDRVYEVVVSDPVAWTLIAAFTDLEVGTN